MTDDLIALARRAVACKGWRWMPGMLTSNGGRVFAVDEDGSCRLDFGAEEVPFWCTPETMRKMTPDLSDPATLGCLLALVREAWESPKANLSWVTDDKCMVVFAPGHAQRFLLGDTEAEALIAALERAP